MSAGASVRTPRLWAVMATVVGVALPATFFVLMVDSIGKEPNGPLLYCPVLLVPSLFGLLGPVVARRIDPNSPGNGLAVAAVVSFVTSVVALVVALVFFIH